jgi:hypothetical protein
MRGLPLAHTGQMQTLNYTKFELKFVDSLQNTYLAENKMVFDLRPTTQICFYVTDINELKERSKGSDSRYFCRHVQK